MSKARDLANAGTALTSVSATELGYLDGVTSAVQTQVDAKIAKSLVTAKGDLIVATASGTVVAQAIGSNGTVLTADSAEADGLKWATVAGGYSTYQVFTSSTTWTVPTGITRCAVYMVGGGSGGMSGETNVAVGNSSVGGGGGAGGSIAYEPFYAVTPAASITVTIGAGGAGASAASSATAALSGTFGAVGTATSFDGNSTSGASTRTDSHSNGAVNSGQTSNFISFRSGGNGANERNAASYTTIKSLLNTQGSIGSSGSAATAGTVQGTAGTSTTAGFAGGGGGGGQAVTPSSTVIGGAGVAGGGAGGAAADSSTNIVTTAGAGGAGAANRGGGGGGGGGAFKVGTTTTLCSSGAGGNGGSGIVIIFY